MQGQQLVVGTEEKRDGGGWGECAFYVCVCPPNVAIGLYGLRKEWGINGGPPGYWLAMIVGYSPLDSGLMTVTGGITK